MARTKSIQRASVPMSFTSRSSTPRPQGALALLVVSALVAVWAVALLSPLGNLINAYMFVYTTFFAGPATLVALSITVMVGLVATDRLVLLIRHRVLLQSAHRSLGIIAVFALVLHILTKISAGHIRPTTAILPFIDGASVYVGLGTVAGAMMVAVLWTGLVRARFAGVGKPWLWRTLHSISYAAWPIALVHGLQAGRPAATWVLLSYLLCVALVLAALGVRLSVSLGRKREEQGMSTGSLAPVGRPGKPGPGGRTSSTAPAKRRTADEIRASRQNSATRDGARPARTSRWSEQETVGGRRSSRDSRWDDQDTLTGRTGEPGIRAGRGEDRNTFGGRVEERESQVSRRRRDSLSDLRDDRAEATIDAWARAEELDSTHAPRGRSERFAVPEVPPAGSMAADADADPELPWDSPRRWAADEEPDSRDRSRRDSEHARYRRPQVDDTFGGTADRSEPGAAGGRRAAEEPGRRSRQETDGSGRRSWREPDDEPVSPGASRVGRRRRAADEEPAAERSTDRAGRHTRSRDDSDPEESTAEWGRAARYEPNLVSLTDDDDDERPALIGLASRRSRKSGDSADRPGRRRQSDEAAEEGAYWTSLKGETR